MNNISSHPPVAAFLPPYPYTRPGERRPAAIGQKKGRERRIGQEELRETESGPDDLAHRG
jgi:hypothetical protein